MRIGIDLGGTKIEGVALGRDHRVIARRRVPTPRNDYEATLAAIAGVVAGLEQDAGQRGTVGVAFPAHLAGDGPRQERELDVAEQTAAP